MDRERVVIELGAEGSSTHTYAGRPSSSHQSGSVSISGRTLGTAEEVEVLVSVMA